MTNNMRQSFERCTESYYEGSFVRYPDNSEYVSYEQQHDFNFFCSGYQAGQDSFRPLIKQMHDALRDVEIGNDIALDMVRESLASADKIMDAI